MIEASILPKWGEKHIDYMVVLYILTFPPFVGDVKVYQTSSLAIFAQ